MPTLEGVCRRLRMGSREASSVASLPLHAPNTRKRLLYEPVAKQSPRPLMQQSNLSKMESFSYRSHSCVWAPRAGQGRHGSQAHAPNA